MFFSLFEAHPERTAILSDSGTSLTYADLYSACLFFRNAIPPRSLILFLADRSVQSLALYYCALSENCVLLPLDEKTPPSVVERFIHFYRPEYIWCRTEQIKNFQCIADTAFIKGDHGLFKSLYPSVRLHKDLALLLTTSGSTGNPKTVRISYTNLLENTKAILEALSLEDGAIGPTTLPIQYTYGAAICNMHFAVGGTLLVTERTVLDPYFHAFIRENNLTNIQGVPYIHEMLDRVGFYNNLPATLSLVTMGGGQAPKRLQIKMNQILKEHGIRFAALYGQTEGTTMLTKIPDWLEMNEPGCIGVACKGMKAAVDPNTNELVFSGSSVCMGYAESADDLQKGNENHGILRTGDLARIDERGCIYLTGRIKRIIKLAGIRVNLDDVETIAAEIFGGAECACCGSENAMVVFQSASTDTFKAKQLLADRLRISQAMFRIEYLEEIPRKGNGKIDYPSLERLQ